MDRNNKSIDLDGVEKWTKIAKNVYQLKISPFCYKGEKGKRLPRKSSKHYNLLQDVADYFKCASDELPVEVEDNRGCYWVNIEVYRGKDTLGRADLDNYCKALLDGITQCKKFWRDDRQVDEVHIRRFYCETEESYIMLRVGKL